MELAFFQPERTYLQNVVVEAQLCIAICFAYNIRLLCSPFFSIGNCEFQNLNKLSLSIKNCLSLSIGGLASQIFNCRSFICCGVSVIDEINQRYLIEVG